MTTKYVPTLGSLSAKALVKNRVIPSKTDITEDAFKIYKQAWLTSEARLFYIPIIYTPLSKELEDVAYEDINEEIAFLTNYIKNDNATWAREKLERFNNIVLNQDVPEGYRFEKPEKGTVIVNFAKKVDINPNNISETLTSLLINSGMKLNRGDLVFYEAASQGKDSLREWFIIDTRENMFFLHALLHGDDFSQPESMKTITEFPPRYWSGYHHELSKCYIDFDLFEDQVYQNTIEVKEERFKNIGLTFIRYNNITYTIIINSLLWEVIKNGRPLINALKLYPLESKFRSPHPVIEKLFASNPYTTMITKV